jgi:hypothetical protein
MNGASFDALTKSMHGARNRRGLLRGVAVLVTAMLAGQQESLAQSVPHPWYCPRGVDGPRRDCICECTRYGFSTIECQSACFACNWHIDAVCPNPDHRGEAMGPPVCCADRKPCRQICGDCPDCEPFPDLL